GDDRDRGAGRLRAVRARAPREPSPRPWRAPGLEGLLGWVLRGRAGGLDGLALRADASTPARLRAGSGASSQRGPDLLREHEADVLVDGAHLGDVLGAPLAEELDQLLDELLGRARPRGDSHRLDPFEPLLAHLKRVVDQVRGGAELAGDLDQAVRVRRIG